MVLKHRKQYIYPCPPKNIIYLLVSTNVLRRPYRPCWPPIPGGQQKEGWFRAWRRS